MALDRRQVTAHRLESDLHTIGLAERHRVKSSTTRRAFAVILGALSSITSNEKMYSLALEVVPPQVRITAFRMREAWTELLMFVAQSTDSPFDDECADIPNVMIRAMYEIVQRHCADVQAEAMLGVFNFWISRQLSWSKRRATNDGVSAAAVIAPLAGRAHVVIELGEASGDLAEMLVKLKSRRRSLLIFERRKSAFLGKIRALAHGFKVSSLAPHHKGGAAVTYLDLRKEGLRLEQRQVIQRIGRGLELCGDGLFCLVVLPTQTRFFPGLDGLGSIASGSLRSTVAIPGTKGHLLYVFAPHGIALQPSTAIVIDGNAIAKFDGSATPIDAAFATGMFAGASLANALSPTGPRPRPIVSKWFMHAGLAELLSAEFRDLEGICRTVPVERLVNIHDGDISPVLNEGPRTERLVDARVRALINVKKKNPRSSCQYIIGNNGAGKSLLLKSLADELIAENTDTLAVAFTSPDRFSKIGYECYRYRGLQASSSYDRFITIDERILSIVVSIHRSPERSKLLYEILTLLGFRADCVAMAKPYDEGNEIAEVDMASSAVNLAEASRAGDDRLLSISLDGMTLGLSRASDEQLIVPYEELSSGERQIVRLVATLVGEVRPGTVVLVDEPEVSLHVAWQAILPQALACLQSAIACHVVVATHSPLVISTTSDEATCYSLSANGLHEIPRNELRSVESALFDGFATYTPRNRAVHEECAHVIAEAITLTSDAEEGRLSAFIEESVGKLGIAAITVARGASMSPESASRDTELINRTVAALREILALDGTPDGP